MLFSALFNAKSRYYFHYILIGTRLFPSFIAGFITIYYINLNANLSPELFSELRFSSITLILLAIVVTIAYGLRHLKGYSKLIQALEANLCLSQNEASRIADKIVTFPMKQLIFEALYCVLAIPIPVIIYLTVFFNLLFDRGVQIMVGGCLGIFITIFFNHLIFDRAIQEPLAFLFRKGIFVDYDRAKKFSLRTKLILSFLLVTLPTVLMVGTLAHQKILDISNSGVVSLEIIENLKLNILLIAIAAFSIAAILALSISSSISAPISNIQKTVEKVQQGDLSSRVLAIQNNEFGNLARQVNTMIHRVQDSTTDLEKKVRERSDQLIQAQKLASIGQLVAGIAHHINNKINPPIQGADLLKTNLTKIKEGKVSFEKILPEMEMAVEAIEEELSVVKTIVDDLLISSHQASLTFQFAPLDLNTLLQSVVRMIRMDCLDRVQIDEDYFPALPKIKGDITHLTDVFVNLLKNALEAIPNKGHIWVKSWLENGSAFISVRDDGVGISEENRSKIFDFFFTTKEVGKGTGLGLGVGYATVKEHDGDILVNSQLGKGSEFIVRLPVVY